MLSPADAAELLTLFDASAATSAFREDVAAFMTHRPAAAITLARHAPRVKVLRVLMQLLSAEPALPTAHVSIDAFSGCPDFRGDVRATPADGTTCGFAFVWDGR